MDNKYDALKLEYQLCFPLYAASREVVKKYHKALSEINLTYTQYIAMMVFWEHKKINVKDLGEKLYLDSGTLTPVLKSLEAKGYVTRKRNKDDERVLMVEITEEGEKLKDKALTIPKSIAGCIKLDENEAIELYRLLNKLLENTSKK